MKDADRKIYLLSHYFYPEIAAVAQYMTELAVELSRQGLNIKVLTSIAPYQRAGTLPPYEQYQGVPIHRFGSGRLSKKRLAGRIMGIVVFLMGVIVELVRAKRAQLLVIANAPILGIIGLVARLVRGQKYVCIIEDVYPELAISMKVFAPNSLIVKLWDAINYRVYTNAECLIVLGKHMEAIVRRKLPADTNIFVIPSWADGEEIRPRAKQENWFALEQQLADRLVVLYSGNHGLAHDLETLIEAAHRLKDNPNIFFLFIGDGGKKRLLVDMVERQGLTNVRFLPYQPLQNLPYSLTCGDVSVVAMEPGTDGLVIPSKMYGSLAAGQAILGLVGQTTEIADIISENSCGYIVPPKDVEQVVDILSRLSQCPQELERLKQNARRCFDKKYRKEIAIDMYRQVFEIAINGYESFSPAEAYRN